MSYSKKMEALREYFNTNIKAKFSAIAAPAPAAMAAPVAPVAPAAPATPAAPAASEYTLADGVTKVTIDRLEVGGQITPAPAAEGVIVLQDGTTISHDAAGVITAVTSKAAAPAEQATEMKTAEQMRAYLAQFADDAAASNTSGLGAPDLNKVVVILRALFEDRFGWELRRAQEEAARAQAVEIYKQGFTAQENFNTQVLELLDMVAEKAPEPTEPAAKAWEEMTKLEQYRATKTIK